MTWGASCFLGKFYSTFEGRPRPLLDSLRFGLLNEEFIGFRFVSVVSFPSCYYICIVGVVRVRTILIFFGKAPISINVYSRCWPATTQYCPRQCSHQKRSRMAAWWSLQRSFSSFYWTKPRILCKGSNCKRWRWNELLAITDRLFGNTSCFVLRTPEIRACACQKSKERSPEK